MDPELTDKLFQDFVGRRGISRAEGGEASSDEADEPRVRASSSATSRATAASIYRQSSIPAPPSGLVRPSPDRRRVEAGPSSAGPFPETDDGTKKQYFCEYCHLPFGRKHHKERHVANIHRQERPYVCGICGFAFHQKPNLDRHRATVHNETRPFRCQECGLQFSRRRALSNHEQTTHDKSKKHVCPVCGSRFATSRELSTHEKSVHQPLRGGAAGAGPSSRH